MRIAALLLAVLAFTAATFWRLPTNGQAGDLSPARARTPASWLRLVLRSGALVLVLLFGAAQAWHAALELPPSARWWLLAAAVIFLLPLLLNTVAGLWFLWRLGPKGLDCSLTALGHAGRLHHVGLTRIALEDGERIALLPYLPLAWQPLAVAPPAGTAASRILLERESWSEEQRRFLRQAAILSPYRDVTYPVSVSVSGRVATIGISALRPEAMPLLERSLARALDEYEGTRSETTAAALEPR